MIYFCCDRLRRNKLAGSAFNGIDYLEVLDHDVLNPDDRQKTLVVHFINAAAGLGFNKDNFRIEGGERIRNIVVAAVTNDASTPEILTLKLNLYGDFSIYTLRIVQNAQNTEPPEGIDPLFAAVDFSFKVDCPTDFDCQPRCDCPTTPAEEPEIDYLAKDYASFRRLMLDRMSVLMPQWQERNPADLGVTLVELLAYVGDHLSYQQDAVATEAYLGTARRRVSVRRHAKLVDYHMHDGCNARAWVQVQVTDDAHMSAGTKLFTRIPGQPAVLPDDPLVRSQAQEVFETMEEVELFKDHNEMHFYTWSDQRCCLPRGATHATLKNFLPNLKVGDVLIFEERFNPDIGPREDTGPATGSSEDADPAHHCAVRLTQVQARDALGQPLTDPLTNVEITQIAWDSADALPFAVCISAQTDSEHGSRFVEDVSVALGNIVLADHGASIREESLGSVPEELKTKTRTAGCDPCDPESVSRLAPRFRPALANQPLTHAAPYNREVAASGAMVWSVRQARPKIELNSTLNNDEVHWTVARDLLHRGAADPNFVVEIESDFRARLRFGDDVLGMRPEAGTDFKAIYRVGNGAAGNVGAEAIAHLATSDAVLAARASVVRNPMPAQGGVEPETVEEVRAYAPAAFRMQERAVTEADYAAVTERYPGVQRAVATFRWTGSWHTVFITVDRAGGLPVDGAFEESVRRHVERYRMAGHDLEIDGPRFVSLDIEMHVCVEPGYFRADVQAELLDVFSNRRLADGRLGQFHPDRFTFGQIVYLSPLIAAAQAVDGVMSVQVTRFQRQGTPDKKPLAAGRFELGRLEIGRCDNDPNFAEHGAFHLTMGGGK